MLYLYEKNTINFTNNGEPIRHSYEERVIREEGFYLTFKLLLDKNSDYKKVKKEMIVSAETPDGRNQFRVYDIVKRKDHVEVVAVQLMYDLDNKMVNPFKVTNVSGTTVINRLVSVFKSSLGSFTLSSSVTETHDFTTNDADDHTPSHNALEVLNRITNRWDSELLVNGYDIRMIKRLGTKTNALLYEKKNISEFEDESSVRGMATRIHATSRFTAEGDEDETVISVTVDSPLINEYAQIYEKSFINNDARTSQELINWVKLKYSTENIDKPKRTINVSTNIIDCTEINYGDDLVLKYLIHDVDEIIRCVGYDYDPISKTYYSITLGDWKDSFTTTLTGGIVDTTQRQINQIKNNVTHILMNADGYHRNAYGPDPVPNPINGDIWYYFEWDRPNEIEMRIFEDGFWVPIPFGTKQEVDAVIAKAEADRIKTEADILEAKKEAERLVTVQSVEFDAQMAGVNQEINTVKSNIDTAISNVNQEIANNFTSLSNSISDVNSIANQAKADAAGAVGEVNFVKQSVNNLSGEVTTLLIRVDGNETAINQVKNTADGTKQTVANHAGRLTTVETNVNGLQISVSDKVSNAQFTVLSNSVSSVVSDLNNLDIGGRNLILRKGIEKGKYVDHATGNALSASTHAVTDFISVRQNTIYTLSALLLWQIRIVFYNENKTRVDGSLYTGNQGQEKTFSTSSNTFFVRFSGDVISGTPLENWMFERGDKASEYSLAPEDTQSQITQLSTDINLRVTKGELLSQINVQADNILIQTNKLYLDVNSVHMTTAFVNDLNVKTLSAITANITSIRSQILQTNVVEATHLKADTAMIDKLFATTALIETLTSKTAFINSIKAIDISADKITSGTLNSAIVNAISLNVSQLVGNISNFVQSNWNSAIGGNVQANGNGVEATRTSDGTRARLSSGTVEFWNTTNNKTGSIGVGYNATDSSVTGVAVDLEYGKEFSVRRKVAAGSTTFNEIFGINWNQSQFSVRLNMSLHDNDLLAVGRLELNRGLGMGNTRISQVPGIDFHSGVNVTGVLHAINNSNIGLFSSGYLALGVGNNIAGTSELLRVAKDNIIAYVSLDMATNSVNRVRQISFYNSSARTGNIVNVSGTNDIGLYGSGSLYLGVNGSDNYASNIRIQRELVQFYVNINMNGKTVTGTSDVRLKTNITSTKIIALNLLRLYNFVDFDWIDPNMGNGRQFGLIAQHTPFLSIYDAENDLWTLDSMKQTMLNSLGIKELDTNVINLADRVNLMDHRFADEINDVRTISNNALTKTQVLERRIEELEEEIKLLKSA